VENSQTEPASHYISSSPDETFNFGRQLANSLKNGSIIALTGVLGAGKTCFTNGIALGLGINEVITSPTYTIINEYDGFLYSDDKGSREKIKFYHIDAYRLSGNEDFTGIGGEEIVFGAGISVIEWSDRIPDFIPDIAYKVDIEILENNTRSIKIYRESNS
jgi:tRNA threonylcarbamoyladenosine biosynthesis protein TsaE